jgi:hypothetical protein
MCSLAEALEIVEAFRCGYSVQLRDEKLHKERCSDLSGKASAE